MSARWLPVTGSRLRFWKIQSTYRSSNKSLGPFKMASDLLHLQGLIRKEPQAYKEEFLMQLRHWDNSLQIFALRPSDDSDEFTALMHFLSHVRSFIDFYHVWYGISFLLDALSASRAKIHQFLLSFCVEISGTFLFSLTIWIYSHLFNPLSLSNFHYSRLPIIACSIIPKRNAPFPHTTCQTLGRKLCRHASQCSQVHGYCTYIAPQPWLYSSPISSSSLLQNVPLPR